MIGIYFECFLGIVILFVIYIIIIFGLICFFCVFFCVYELIFVKSGIFLRDIELREIMIDRVVEDEGG